MVSLKFVKRKDKMAIIIKDDDFMVYKVLENRTPTAEQLVDEIMMEDE